MTFEILMDAPRNNKSDVVRSTEVCTTGDPLSANTFPGSSYKMSECANLNEPETQHVFEPSCVMEVVETRAPVV
jgi:hypothetical protein